MSSLTLDKALSSPSIFRLPTEILSSIIRHLLELEVDSPDARARWVALWKRTVSEIPIRNRLPAEQVDHVLRISCALHGGIPPIHTVCPDFNDLRRVREVCSRLREIYVLVVGDLINTIGWVRVEIESGASVTSLGGVLPIRPSSNLPGVREVILINRSQQALYMDRIEGLDRCLDRSLIPTWHVRSPTWRRSQFHQLNVATMMLSGNEESESTRFKWVANSNIAREAFSTFTSATYQFLIEPVHRHVNTSPGVRSEQPENKQQPEKKPRNHTVVERFVEKLSVVNLRKNQLSLLCRCDNGVWMHKVGVLSRATCSSVSLAFAAQLRNVPKDSEHIELLVGWIFSKELFFQVQLRFSIVKSARVPISIGRDDQDKHGLQTPWGL